jgi:pyruvate formate lyase activating enzyme
VKETLLYLKRETRVWFELTTLLIPGENDSEAELEAMTQWVAGELGPDVPMHFTAFHPDYRMLDRDATPLAALERARRIARRNGVRYAYTGNVSNPGGESTTCHACDALLVRRDRYRLSAWGLTDDGRCVACGAPWAGVVEGRPGTWGARRLPVVLGVD